MRTTENNLQADVLELLDHMVDILILYARSRRPVLVQRDLRVLWRTMPAMDIEPAIQQLLEDGLLSPEAPGGDQSFVVDPVVFALENRLPALVTDPRRPKQ